MLGDPTQSILWYRMYTETLGARMPDIGRAVRHDRGADLVARWIEGIEGSCDGAQWMALARAAEPLRNQPGAEDS